MPPATIAEATPRVYRAPARRPRLPPFQRFVEANCDAVWRFLLVAAGPDDAEDCFQETFLAALRAYPDLRNDDNLRGWVLVIARRKALDAARARGSAPIAVAQTPEPPPAPDRSSPAGDAPLWTLARRLPETQRSALLLRVVGELSYAEVGAALGCSEEAARRRVHEALRTLREHETLIRPTSRRSPS